MSREVGEEPATPAAQRRRALPLWLMGMTNALFGMYGGILVISVPELLNARHVSEATISAMTAVTISPGFWSIVASPMLDVRFTRRWYSTVTAVVAAVLLSFGLFYLDDVLLAEILLVTGFFAANLYQSALGGWLSSIIAPEERNALSVWVTIANISGGGAMAIVAGELMQRFSPVVAVLVSQPYCYCRSRRSRGCRRRAPTGASRARAFASSSARWSVSFAVRRCCWRLQCSSRRPPPSRSSTC